MVSEDIYRTPNKVGSVLDHLDSKLLGRVPESDLSRLEKLVEKFVFDIRESAKKDSVLESVSELHPDISKKMKPSRQQSDASILKTNPNFLLFTAFFDLITDIPAHEAHLAPKRNGGSSGRRRHHHRVNAAFDFLEMLPRDGRVFFTRQTTTSDRAQLLKKVFRFQENVPDLIFDRKLTTKMLAGMVWHNYFLQWNATHDLGLIETGTRLKIPDELLEFLPDRDIALVQDQGSLDADASSNSRDVLKSWGSSIRKIYDEQGACALVNALWKSTRSPQEVAPILTLFDSREICEIFEVVKRSNPRVVEDIYPALALVVDLIDLDDLEKLVLNFDELKNMVHASGYTSPTQSNPEDIFTTKYYRFDDDPTRRYKRFTDDAKAKALAMSETILDIVISLRELGDSELSLKIFENFYSHTPVIGTPFKSAKLLKHGLPSGPLMRRYSYLREGIDIHDKMLACTFLGKKFPELNAKALRTAMRNASNMKPRRSAETFFDIYDRSREPFEYPDIVKQFPTALNVDGNKYNIEFPATPLDLAGFGKDMDNCAADYADDIWAQKSVIFVATPIRDSESRAIDQEKIMVEFRKSRSGSWRVKQVEPYKNGILGHRVPYGFRNEIERCCVQASINLASAVSV